MREGKPGGGKGPLLAVDESLTLAQGNGQVLFFDPPDKPMTTRQPPTKLTVEQVTEAVMAYEMGESISVIATRMSVSRQSMWDLLRRRTQMRDRLESLPRKPTSEVRVKRAETLRRYRARAARITEAQVRAVRERDGTCRSCGGPGTDIDHILAVSLGGQTTLENLQLLCHPCHIEKSRTDRRLAAAMRKEVMPPGSPPLFGVEASRDRAKTSPSPGSGPGSESTIGTLREHVRPGSNTDQVVDWQTLHENSTSPTPTTPTDPMSPDRSRPAPASPSPSSTLWSDTDLPPSSSRTSRASSPVIAGEISRHSSIAFRSSGMAWRGGWSMQDTSECRSAADESSSSPCEAIPTTLTDILQPSAPPRYSLSARAASGILRRAARRGRALPESLERALTSLADSPGATARASIPPQMTAPSSSQVRRLTPVETEMLMGWPPYWTVVTDWRK